MRTERLDTAAVFERILAIYRRQAGVLLPVALIVWLIPAGLSVANGVTARALSLAAGIIAAVAYQGIVVLAVQDMEDGARDFTIGGLLRSVAPVLGPLMWTAILVGLGLFAGFLAFIIPGLFLWAQWAVAVPAVVLEECTPTRALGRSRELVHGNGWGVFGVLVVSLMLVLIIDFGCLSIAYGISQSDISVAIGNLLGGALSTPVLGLTSAVLYLALRGPRPSGSYN